MEHELQINIKLWTLGFVGVAAIVMFILCQF
jgi:hypothetical protein